MSTVASATAPAPGGLRERRWGPRRWIGGACPGGLLLPDASPTPSTMYGPRGVCLTDDALIVADTGNHRLLLWSSPVPAADHCPADAVVGQPDFSSESPRLLHLPTGVLVTGRRLVVCDAWHHRLLVWDDFAEAPTRPPSLVLGQEPRLGLDGTAEGCGPQRFYWPFGAAVVNGALWVADTGNRRVLGWLAGIPEPGQPADVVLGQPDLFSRGENRDGAPSASSMRWPHAIADAGGHLLVADAGNHRVLGWKGTPEGDRPAEIVLGQPDFATATENPYRPQGPRSFRFPYGLAAAPDGRIFVGDTSNNRICCYDNLAEAATEEPAGAPADTVLGQPNFDANGENRWDRVGADTFCWPYGLAFHDGLLAVADSGNNRVMLWAES